MEKRTIASISATCGILWIFLFQNMINTVTGLWASIVATFSGVYAALGETIFAGTLLVVTGVMVGVAVFQLLTKRFEIVFTAILALLYLWLLFHTLFRADAGTRGINFNLGTFGERFTGDPLGMMWTIVLCLPLGVMVQLVTKKIWQTALGAAVVILMVEGAQYIFSTGVCDIVDMLLGLVGVMLGGLIVSSALLDGWSFGVDRHFLAFTK
ncbi:VanZ family protein [Pseudoscardovia radai]|uniref:VanZ family protein n=1 Tax=Pseudoscardovia radai TaxID=987066 RepID=UPI0039917D33